MKLHQEYRRKTVKCEICGKCFKSPSDVEKHMVTHTGARDYKCEICTESFPPLLNILTRHKKIHEEPCPFPNPERRSFHETFVENLTSPREQETLTVTKLISATKSFLARSVDWSLKDLVNFKFTWQRYVFIALDKHIRSATSECKGICQETCFGGFLKPETKLLQMIVGSGRRSINSEDETEMLKFNGPYMCATCDHSVQKSIATSRTVVGHWTQGHGAPSTLCFVD